MGHPSRSTEAPATRDTRQRRRIGDAPGPAAPAGAPAAPRMSVMGLPLSCGFGRDSQPAHELRSSAPARARAVVAERIVALAHRLAEADGARAGDEVEPLLGVARDAVEERTEGAARGEPHVLGGLVAE